MVRCYSVVCAIDVMQTSMSHSPRIEHSFHDITYRINFIFAGIHSVDLTLDERLKQVKIGCMTELEDP